MNVFNSLGLLATAVAHPSGHGVQALWSAVENSRPGLQRNALAWCDLPCWVGVVAGVDDMTHADKNEQSQTVQCRSQRLAWLALQDPVFQSTVRGAIDCYGPSRIGLLIGTSASGMRETEIAYAEQHRTGEWPAGYAYRRTHSVDALCKFSANMLGIVGPMAGISTACSSSAKVFITAAHWIAAGIVDAVVVGGVDSLCLSTLHGFQSLQLLSEEICRPFDLSRNGISIGEAAGFVLLGRGPAAIRFSGGGESSDAWHMSAPHPEGLGAQHAMRMAITEAGLTPSDIGYVNAHGTATPSNDRAEAAALVSVFGERGVPTSSTKGITGHTLGAAGIVEAIITAQALERQMLPATANLAAPDPKFGLDLLLQTRKAPLRHAMSNSFGFGGSNCALIFSLAD